MKQTTKPIDMKTIAAVLMAGMLSIQAVAQKHKATLISESGVLVPKFWHADSFGGWESFDDGWLGLDVKSFEVNGIIYYSFFYTASAQYKYGDHRLRCVFVMKEGDYRKFVIAAQNTSGALRLCDGHQSAVYQATDRFSKTNSESDTILLRKVGYELAKGLWSSIQCFEFELYENTVRFVVPAQSQTDGRMVAFYNECSRLPFNKLLIR